MSRTSRTLHRWHEAGLLDDAARDRIRTRLDEYTGLTVTRIDVTVTVLTGAAPRPTGRVVA